jgi:hypothetical protein
MVGQEIMQDDRVNRLLSPVLVAEMVSNKNTATDYLDFYRKLLESEKELFPNEPAVKPLMCMTDCSAPLEAAALVAFSLPGVAISRIKYGNYVLLYLLCYDKMIWDININPQSSDSTVHKLACQKAACEVLGALEQHTHIFLKECSAHVYRAPFAWAKNSKKLPGNQKKRLDSLFKAFFSSVLRDSQISEAIVRFSIVLAVLETPRFKMQSFTEDNCVDCPGEKKTPPRSEGRGRTLRIGYQHFH